VRGTDRDVDAALKSLCTEGHVFDLDGIFALREESCSRRIQHARRNERLHRKARWVGLFIYTFPFVRGVYLSGSLAKDGATGEDDDLDFFILTKKDRVWSAKLLLIAFKKVFLLNKEKYFCINFLMGEGHLELAKDNLYYAVEAATLVPLANAGLLHDFYAANPMVQTHFPNFQYQAPAKRRGGFRPLEWTLDFFAGDFLEHKARAMFARHVAQERTDAGYFDTSDNVSAYFPDSVEERLLNYYNEHKR
jgi:hypothetical protein